MTEPYEILARNIDNAEIADYDKTIWSPRSIVERDPNQYGVDEPADLRVSAEILREVENAKKEAEESNSIFFNGPLTRVKDFEEVDGDLKLYVQNTNYFSHSGTQGRPDLDKNNRADPLSVGALLKTSDGNIVLGEKSGLNNVGQGEYQLPGAGFVEEIEESVDSEPEDSIYRELNEEVNLNSEDLSAVNPEALVGAVHRQPMLVYNAETELDSREVADQWSEQSDEEREFSDLIFVDENDIERVLEGEPDVIASQDGELKIEEYDGELRPHVEGALTLI